jgi:hypothetical protein
VGIVILRLLVFISCAFFHMWRKKTDRALCRAVPEAVSHLRRCFEPSGATPNATLARGSPAAACRFFDIDGDEVRTS